MADDRKSEMEAVLRKQRAAHNQMRPEPMALRKDRIQRAMKLLTDHAEDLCKVMAADFGNRSPHQSMIADIAGTVTSSGDTIRTEGSITGTFKGPDAEAVRLQGDTARAFDAMVVTLNGATASATLDGAVQVTD